HDEACVRKELAHLTDPANIFHPVVIGKAQIAAQAMAYVVTIQQKGVVTPLVQGDVQRIGNSGFTAATQPGKPEQARLLVLIGGTLGAGNFMIVPDYVAHTALQPHSG